jgi:arylsulfatase A-like enzyme
MPEVAWHHPAAVHGMGETPKFNGTSNSKRARVYRRAYDAAIAYTDYNVGKVLEELEALGFRNDTVRALPRALFMT